LLLYILIKPAFIRHPFTNHLKIIGRGKVDPSKIFAEPNIWVDVKVSNTYDTYLYPSWELLIYKFILG